MTFTRSEYILITSQERPRNVQSENVVQISKNAIFAMNVDEKTILEMAQDETFIVMLTFGYVNLDLLFPQGQAKSAVTLDPTMLDNLNNELFDAVLIGGYTSLTPLDIYAKLGNKGKKRIKKYNTNDNALSMSRCSGLNNDPFLSKAFKVSTYIDRYVYEKM